MGEMILVFVLMFVTAFVSFILGFNASSRFTRSQFKKAEPVITSIVSDLVWKCMNEGMTKEQMKIEMAKEMDFFKIFMKSE